MASYSTQKAHGSVNPGKCLPDLPGCICYLHIFPPPPPCLFFVLLRWKPTALRTGRPSSRSVCESLSTSSVSRPSVYPVQFSFQLCMPAATREKVCLGGCTRTIPLQNVLARLPPPPLVLLPRLPRRAEPTRTSFSNPSPLFLPSSISLAFFKFVPGPKWSLIADKIPGKTATACMLHWRVGLNPNHMVKGSGTWTAEEDERLSKLVEVVGMKVRAGVVSTPLSRVSRCVAVRCVRAWRDSMTARLFLCVPCSGLRFWRVLGMYVCVYADGAGAFGRRASCFFCLVCAGGVVSCLCRRCCVLSLPAVLCVCLPRERTEGIECHAAATFSAADYFFFSSTKR